MARISCEGWPSAGYVETWQTLRVLEIWGRVGRWLLVNEEPSHESLLTASVVAFNKKKSQIICRASHSSSNTESKPKKYSKFKGKNHAIQIV